MTVKLTEVKKITEEFNDIPVGNNNKEAEYNAILAAFNVASRILAIRFFLFLSLAGSFVLSVIATNNQSTLSIWVIGIFALVTTMPLTLLEFRGKRG